MNTLKSFLGVVFILLATITKADYPPDIYAISRIQLKSGEILEGIIQIAGVGECGYHPNGFVDIIKGDFYTRFFSLDSTERWGSPAYYLLNETGGCEPQTSKIDSSGNEIYILKEITKKYTYKLLDTIPLYTDIDIGGRPIKETAMPICVKDILRMRYIPQPSFKWIDLIAQRKKEFDIDWNTYPDNWGEDFFEPIWLHTITDSDRFNMFGF